MSSVPSVRTFGSRSLQAQDQTWWRRIFLFDCRRSVRRLPASLLPTSPTDRWRACAQVCAMRLCPCRCHRHRCHRRCHRRRRRHRRRWAIAAVAASLRRRHSRRSQLLRAGAAAATLDPVKAR